MSGKSLYETLGVQRDATDDDIKRAYRRIALESHPDRNPGDKAAESRFKEATGAFAVLSNPEKKLQYDLLGLVDEGSPPAGRRAGVRNPWGTSPEVLQDMLQDLFKTHGQGFRSRARTRHPHGSAGPGPSVSRPGEDVDAEVSITLEEAVLGCKKRLSVQSNNTTVTCTTCRGTGARPGSPSGPCAACAGCGSRPDYRIGVGERVSQCPACRGRGSVPVHACFDCRGKGSIRMEREVDVKIPSGIEDGQKLRLAGLGSPGLHSPPGDLIVSVSVTPHETFRRKGKDLFTSKQITIVDLLRGTTVSINTIGGPPVDLRIPRGVQPGEVVTMHGAGLAGTLEKKRGDLYVTIETVIPKVRSARAAKLLEELAEELERHPGHVDDRDEGVVTDGIDDFLGAADLGIKRS